MPNSPTVSLLRPAAVTQRAWLDREALRIAAGVRGASADDVGRRVFLGNIQNGLPEDVAAADADLALEYIAARLDQIEAMRSAPPPPVDGGARWQA